MINKRIYKNVAVYLILPTILIGVVVHSELIKKETSVDVPPSLSSTTIVLGPDGFDPNDLTVSMGDTVTFISTKGNHFWPASNLHPTHRLYQAFDPEKPINPEESWSFTFMDAGEWRYHDHLAPYFTGTITVIDDEDVSLRDRCENNRGSIECWQKPLFRALKEEGLEASLSLLAKMYKTEPEFKSSCHGITHNIGIAAYENFLKDKDSILSPNAAYCGNGFYHGFMEAFLSVTRDVKAAREFCLYVDEKLVYQSPDAGLQCFHGIGHGLMDLAVFTSFIDGVTKVDEHSLTKPALLMCEVASNRKEELYRCVSAVFNSIANYYYRNEYNLEINEEDPLWLCREQPEKYKESCYGNMNTALFYVADKNFSKAVSFVDNMKDRERAPETMRYLSLTFSLSVENKEDAEEVIAVCRGVRESLQEPCLSGIVHGFLEHGTPGFEYQDGMRFCSYPIFTEQEKITCFTAALSNLNGWYGGDKIEAICNSIEKEYKKYCREPSKN